MVEFIVILLIFMIYMAFRNYAVYKEQIRLCNVIYELNKKDIVDGTYSIEKVFGRYEQLEKTMPYHKMLLTFWIPVKKLGKDIELN